MEYKDIMMVITAFAIILGSILSIIGLWELRKHRKQAV